MAVRLTPWPSLELPTETAIRQLLTKEGLTPHSWSNGPHDTYAAHSHTYNKVIYVVEGSITFGLTAKSPEGDENRKLTLNPGDRLDLPAGVVHSALVGPQGVTCLEAHRHKK